MATNDTINIEVDHFHHLFIKARESLLTETEALQIPLTETFGKYLRAKIDHRHLIIIAVRGEVRTGKSTVVLKIVWEINKYMAQIGLNKEAINHMTKYIFSDDTEFLRFINSDDRNVAIAIDEKNGMGDTGLNATTENALYEHYSRVFAGQYLHRVTAAPDIITDSMATIILDVIGKDEQKESVRCKLSYRSVTTKQQMVLGYVDISVKDLIHNWNHNGIRQLIETHGLRTQNMNNEQRRLVDKYRQEDFYVRYQIKKYRRMDLTKQHGVRDIRDLEFSVIILQVLQELQDHAKIMRITKELVDVVVDETCKQNKRIYSILTVNEISQRARAILNLYHEIHVMHSKAQNPKLLPEERLTYNKTIEQTKQLLQNRLEQQHKYANVYQEYMRIE